MAKIAANSSTGVLHGTYTLTLLGKGLLGLSQLIAGLALALIPASGLAKLADFLVRAELAEDPSDPFALLIQRMFDGALTHEGTFYTVYLVIHGALNLGLVLALMAKLNWAYPVSILALSGFVVYQFYKFSMTGSAMMIVLSVIDLVVIWLIWREYRMVSRFQSGPPPLS